MHPCPAAALDSLHGLAVGDAFGNRWFRLRATREEAIAARRTPPRDEPWFWSDDTAQAVVLLRHLRGTGGTVHQDALARALADAYTADPHRQYGPSMHDVLRRIGAGEPWAEVVAGQFEGQGSWGNGAAMRAAPLGAWHAGDPDTAAGQAALQAAVSHHHPEAAAGAVAVAVAAALAAGSRGAPPPAPAAFLAAVADRLPDGDVRSGLRTAARFPVGTTARHAASVLGSGYRVSAPDTVPFALWCAAAHPDDLEAALWTTAAGLGDADTTCAIAGGVTAARTGTAALPRSWLDALEPLPPLT